MESIETFLQQNSLKNKTTEEQKEFLRKHLIRKRNKAFNECLDKINWGKKQFFNALSILNVKNQDELEQKYRIACFFPIQNELNFLPFAKSDWLFPKVINDSLYWFHLDNGKFGYQLSEWNIPERKNEFCFEYKSSAKPLICFTPGLAGDKTGERLGYGKGFYDRFLTKHPEIISVLCLPSEDFLFDQLPSNTHDKKITHIVA